MIHALTGYFSKKSDHTIQALLVVVLAATLFTRLINLNYNSPSIDEAIYVMIGRLGLFQNDWWSYNPSTWLAGLPYIYPTIAATTYMIGGIIASRLFNIILSVLLVSGVFTLTWSLFKTRKTVERVMAATTAAALTGGAAIGIVVSRLATYDIPSFYLFVASLLFLIRAEEKPIENGRSYFYGAMLLLFASLTKIIIGVYVPFVFLYAAVKAKMLSKKHFSFFLKYFALPLIIGLGIYGLTNLSAILTYADISATRDKESYMTLAAAAWKHLALFAPFYLVGSLGLFIAKRFRLWILLSLASLLVIAPHFVTQRAIWTMEKQTFLTISLLAPIAGIGIASLFSSLRFNVFRSIFTGFLISAVLWYWGTSFVAMQPYNSLWQDTRPYTAALQSNVMRTDKILSESGAPFIVATYDYVYPLNVTTFDYFTYRGKTGDEAYVAAVRDGYFDVIQLNGTDAVATSYNPLRGKVIAALNGNYRLVMTEKNYVMYRRAF